MGGEKLRITVSSPAELAESAAAGVITMENMRLPPQSIEAEMSVLGGVLLDHSEIETVHSILAPEDFYRESHRKIFAAMAALTDRNEPVDLITVSEQLKSAGYIDEIGGAPYLCTLVDYVPTSANTAHYCRIVAQKAAERRLMANAQEAVNIIQDGGTIDEAVAKLEAAIQPAIKQGSAPVAMSQSVREAAKRIETRYETRGTIQGIPYGLAALDKVTSGMHRGELIIVAGRPSMGKSAMAGNVLTNVCLSGMNSLLFTLEMSRSDIVDRLIAGQGIKYQHIRSGNLKDSEWAYISNAFSKLHEWRLSIDDTPAISLRDLRAKARRVKSSGLDLIVVDYLQLMSTTNNRESRTQGLGEISRGLKQLARELDVPIIALSQLSRAVDSRPDKRPMMSDLRDSGEIEQDADVILFPYRPAVYCQKCRDRVNDGEHNYREHQADAEIIIEKQRAGERNISIPACWIGEYQRFDAVDLTEVM